MRLRPLLRVLFLLAVPLAACGDLPEPFLGNPGATARRLSVPLTPILAVAPARDALLPEAAQQTFSEQVTNGLVKEEVPALARAPRRTEWRLAITAERRGDRVIPRYALVNPAGREMGAIEGSAFPAARWTAGDPTVLKAANEDAVPRIVALMTSVRATYDRADPNSLVNRIPRVYVPEVTGAPGDGNPTLTRLIRTRLTERGPLVQVTPDNADFTVKGVVSVTPSSARGRQQVEIAWTVLRPSGALSGKVSQLNSVPQGSLDGYWGDVALAVTQEAANGVHTVIERFAGREPEGTAAPAAAPAPGGPAATPGGPAGREAARVPSGEPGKASATVPADRDAKPHKRKKRQKAARTPPEDAGAR